MYVCMSVCLYVCMGFDLMLRSNGSGYVYYALVDMERNEEMKRRIDGRKEGWVDGWMDGWMDRWMDG